MRQRDVIYMMICILGAMAVWPVMTARAREGGEVELRIRLRAGDGSAVVGEPVVLQRFPEEEDVAPACRTDDEGFCVWRVRRSLYQLLFDRPLDAVSALAVAEGGLQGLGVTVGDAPITYHFTFHSDGGVYFDVAPEAAVPVPFIPEPDELHGDAPATVVSPTAAVTTAAPTPTPESTPTPVAVATPTVPSSWRLLILVGLGLVAGGGLHLWTRKRRRSDSSLTGEGEDA